MASIRVENTKGQKLGALIPYPASDANKYTRGKLVVVGGSAAYPGAICMASSAALRMGAGYVEVICAPEALSSVHAFNPNVVARGWDGWTASTSHLDESGDEGHPKACLIGSGMDGSNANEAYMVLDVLEHCACPVVVDGGAITALASDAGRMLADVRRDKGFATIATPHFGEAARLGRPFGLEPPRGSSTSQIENAEFAQALSNSYHATVILKGPDSYIASPDAEGRSDERIIHVMTCGTAVLAKAGTGDVLAGMLSALVAQGLHPDAAAILATNLHAQAGRLAAKSMTEVCVCASDLIDFIPVVIRQYDKG